VQYLYQRLLAAGYLLVCRDTVAGFFLVAGIEIAACMRR
jgi:hypothetical protein